MEVKTQTPEEIALEQNFNRMLRESEEEKFRQKNFGIGYFGRGTKFNE